MEAPTLSGDKRSDCARTGAPAKANTALVPTLRSSVLLPDMLEPLTTYTRGAPLCQPWCREGFALETREHFRQQRQLTVRMLGGADHLGDPAVQPRRQKRLRKQQRCEEERPGAEEVPRQRRAGGQYDETQ